MVYHIGAFIGGLLIGLLCGLWPFILGRRKGQPHFALAALFACIISGAVLGILAALPVAIAFVVLIYKKASAAGTANAGIAGGVSPAITAGTKICPECSGQIGSDSTCCGVCGHRFS